MKEKGKGIVNFYYPCFKKKLTALCHETDLKPLVEDITSCVQLANSSHTPDSPISL